MIRRKTVWTLCLLSLLFAGCSSKEEKALLQVYNKEKVYHKKLLQTEKIQLYDGNETKVLLTATYIFEQSDVKKEDDRRDEVFIVGFYMEDETVRDQLAEDFNLTLNGTLPKSVKVLKRSDKRLKEIPLVTEWGDYFEVVFPHTQSTKFDLVFSSEMYGKKKLHFAKKAKYVFTKEAF
jgi:hypothetical protein